MLSKWGFYIGGVFYLVETYEKYLWNEKNEKLRILKWEYLDHWISKKIFCKWTNWEISKRTPERTNDVEEILARFDCCKQFATFWLLEYVYFISDIFPKIKQFEMNRIKVFQIWLTLIVYRPHPTAIVIQYNVIQYNVKQYNLYCISYTSLFCQQILNLDKFWTWLTLLYSYAKIWHFYYKNLNHMTFCNLLRPSEKKKYHLNRVKKGHHQVWSAPKNARSAEELSHERLW